MAETTGITSSMRFVFFIAIAALLAITATVKTLF